MIRLIDKRKKYPVKIVWAPYLEGYLVPILFGRRVQVLEAFSMYLFSEAKEKIELDGVSKSEKTAYKALIRKKAYGLSAFAQFLEDNNKDWKDVDDQVLLEFRDKEQLTIRQAKASRTDLSSKRSANDKLRQVYHFYLWAQEVQLLLEDHMGWPEAKIKSKLPEERKDPGKFAKSTSLKKLLFPMCYRKVGENSRRRNTHYATDEELDDLRDYFYTNCNYETAERNVLMVDIIEAIGWRQGSVHSLLITQFHEDAIDKAIKNRDGWFKVCPPSQKGGHENTYDIPLPLAIRILSFIKKSRQGLIDLRGKSEVNAKEYLFISYTTCNPLGETEVSRIISAGFTSIGSQLGSGPHSIRRKFGKEKASEIIEIRKRLGYSISPEDVVQDMMDALGHSHNAAQEAYTSGKLDMYKLSIEARLRLENEELKSKVAEMEVKLMKYGKAPNNDLID